MREHAIISAVLPLALALAHPAQAGAPTKTTPPTSETAEAPPPGPTTEQVAEPLGSAEVSPAGLGLHVGAKLGATYPTNKLAITYFGAVEVGYTPPVLQALVGLPLGVSLEFAYVDAKASGSETEPLAGGDYDWKLDQRLMTLAIDVTAGLPMGDLTPYGAVGYGFYFLRAKARAFGARNEETQVRAGLQLRGGAAYRLGPGDIFGELRYHYTRLDFLTTGKTNAGGITLGLGYRFPF